MATFTVRPEGIIRQPALTMPGNATGAEAACTSLTASQIRTLLSLGTTSDVTFDIVRATTSVLSPLFNNPAAAATTLGNATYGVTVPGAITTPKVTITEPSGAPVTPFIVSVPDQNTYAIQVIVRNTNKSLNVWMDNSGHGNLITDNAFIVHTGGFGNTRLTISAAGAATFTGALSCAGITASGVVSHGAYTVATLPSAGSNAGKMAQVTDSNVAASGNYGATVAAGGANRVKVFSDGTNWVIA